MSASGNLFHDENDFSYKLSATAESEKLARTQRAHQVVLTSASSQMPPFLVVHLPYLVCNEHANMFQ